MLNFQHKIKTAIKITSIVKSGVALYQKIDITRRTICVENSNLYQKQHSVGIVPLYYIMYNTHYHSDMMLAIVPREIPCRTIFSNRTVSGQLKLN